MSASHTDRGILRASPTIVQESREREQRGKERRDETEREREKERTEK